MALASILDEIVAAKRVEVEAAKGRLLDRRWNRRRRGSRGR